MRANVQSAVLISVLLAPSVVAASPITSAVFFNQPGDVTVTFDGIANNSELTTQIAGLRFSSEDVVGVADTTDPADASGRFGSPFLVLSAVSGGGVPVSPSRYASGDVHLGVNVSDMRVDFLSPVSAFGMFVIDNDFSTARIRAFDALGALLETRVVPEVAEGGVAYHGIASPGISYFILDGNPGGPAFDSTFIDNLSFRPAAASVPEPGMFSLAVLGLAAATLRRRAKGKVAATHRR